MNDYHNFRKSKLEKVSMEYPHLPYKEKMKIISHMWKLEKERFNKPLTEEELENSIINEEFMKRLEVTYVREVSQRTLKWMVRLMKHNKHPEVLYEAFHQAFNTPEFYTFTHEGLDIWDFMVIHFSNKLLFELFQTIPITIIFGYINKIQSEPIKRIGSILNVYVSNVLTSPNLTQIVCDKLMKLVALGLNPNTEFFNPIIHPTVSYDDRVTNYISKKNLKLLDVPTSFIRYASYTEPETVYREKIINSNYYKMMIFDLDYDYNYQIQHYRLVGDTVFGVMLHNSSKMKLRDQITKLIVVGGIHLNTVIKPYSLKITNPDVSVDYLTMALISDVYNVRSILSHTIFTRGYPTYMLFRITQNQNHPYNNFYCIKKLIETNWKTCILLNTSRDNLIMECLRKGIIKPTPMQILDKIIISRDYYKDVVEAFQDLIGPTNQENINIPIYKRITKPLTETTLSSLCFHPDFLDGVFGLKEKIPLESIVESNYLKVMERIKTYTKPITEKEPINEFTFSTSEPVADMLNNGWLSFTLEDGYMFFPDEWHYLIKTSKNPFTNQYLGENDILKLTHLYTDYFTNWIYFEVNKLPKLEYSMNENYSENLMDIACKIDAFLEESEMIPYGNRIAPRISSIPNIEKMKLFIISFLTSPVIYSGIQGLSDYDKELMFNCISFSPIKNVDSPDLDEINLYFNMKTQAMIRLENCNQKVLFRTILEWIYAVLETTKLYTKHLFEGRCLSVNYSLFFLN